MRNKPPHSWSVTRYWQPAGRPADFDPPESDRPDRSHMALALGIVSLIFAPLGVIAWAFASSCLRAIDEGRMDPAGESNARAGRVLGIIATCLFVFKVTAFVPLFVFARNW
jgi:hypothetical protein